MHPPSEIKLNKKFKTLRWRLLRWLLTLSDRRSGRIKKYYDEFVHDRRIDSLSAEISCELSPGQQGVS